MNKDFIQLIFTAYIAIIPAHIGYQYHWMLALVGVIIGLMAATGAYELFIEPAIDRLMAKERQALDEANRAKRAPRAKQFKAQAFHRWLDRREPLL